MLAVAGRGHAAGDPAKELADRYAPVVRLVAQAEPCGHGEPYEPTDVDVVLDSPDVALRGPWAGGAIVKIAPTAADLAEGLTGYHLDFPGDALNPGCDYEKWSRLITEGAKPTMYARVVADPGYPGKLALQYWFFYVFNDFNDKHEGDWEMVQLDFDAATPAAALGVKPYELGYSQHEGAERARWGDSKLQIVDGTHPVVYSALGSHANYYTSALHLGRSAAQGVGCDDTIGPSRDVRPVVDLVPTDRAAYLKAFPWLGYDGHWGEQHGGFYNGPTGPNTKKQWTQPIAWAETTWRGTSYAVPEASSVGTSATDFFCGAVAAGSNVLTATVANPTPTVVILTGIVVLLLWLASGTRWDLSAPHRLARRRPWGSLITSAFAMYSRHLRLFLGIGLAFVPLALVITAVQYLIFRVGPLGSLVDSVGASNAFVAILALALGLFMTLLGLTVVQAVVALAMVELDEGRPVTPLRAYRLVLPRLRRLLRALLLAALVVALLDLTVVGLVVSIWLVVRWILMPQVVVLEERRVRPLQRSWELVGGHWLRVGSISLLVTGGGLLLGPLLGTLLLFVTSASFNVINLVAGLVYVVALPFAAITQSYLYFDLRVAEHVAGERKAVPAVLPAEL